MNQNILRQLHIYEYQVEEEIMKEKGVMFLDVTKNIAYILITLGGLLTVISGIFCIKTLLRVASQKNIILIHQILANQLNVHIAIQQMSQKLAQ